MPPCLHLDPRGRRCGRETEAELAFCTGHQPDQNGLLPAGETSWRRRLAALLLLAAFLVPLAVQGYRLLRALVN